MDDKTYEEIKYNGKLIATMLRLDCSSDHIYFSVHLILHNNLAVFLDFRILVSVITNLEGGVYLNIGSAVILPEVFLKALIITRNLGYKAENISATNLGMQQHYRPFQNVAKRPTSKGEKDALSSGIMRS